VKNDDPSGLRFTFKKEERLSSKKLIDELFKNGSSFYLHPFRIYHLDESFAAATPVQVLITAPQKNFRQAVDRNRIRRLIREAYRLNKHLLCEPLNSQRKKMIIAFIYSGKKIEPFELIQDRMMAILSRLADDRKDYEKHAG
jgi:ribonuclease P protein component